MSSVDLKKVSSILRECAKECILPYFRNLAPHEINKKDDATQSAITIADPLAEKFLSSRLVDLLPDSFVVGEEDTYDNESNFDYLQDPEKMVWVIDPIDGTANFANDSEVFCIMVALVKDGVVEMAWIYDVCNDSMTVAKKGQGVFINGQKIVLSTPPQEERTKGFAVTKLADQVGDVEITTLHCAGHEYLKVLKNEAIFSVYDFMQPWDHAAGTFMIEEAGGYVAKWDGSPYSAKDKTGGIIVANNKETWQKVKNAIPDKVLQNIM